MRLADLLERAGLAGRWRRRGCGDRLCHRSPQGCAGHGVRTRSRATKFNGRGLHSRRLWAQALSRWSRGPRSQGRKARCIIADAPEKTPPLPRALRGPQRGLSPFPDTIVAVTGTKMERLRPVEMARQIWRMADERAASNGTLGVTTPDGSLPPAYTPIIGLSSPI